MKKLSNEKRKLLEELVRQQDNLRILYDESWKSSSGLCKLNPTREELNRYGVREFYYDNHMK